MLLVALAAMLLVTCGSLKFSFHVFTYWLMITKVFEKSQLCEKSQMLLRLSSL